MFLDGTQGTKSSNMTFINKSNIKIGKNKAPLHLQQLQSARIGERTSETNYNHQVN
jgi:hypothetical protein